MCSRRRWVPGGYLVTGPAGTCDEGGKGAMTETTSGPAARKGKRAAKGLKIRRIHTTAGVHPYDQVTWERRDVVMTNWRDGSINFEQRGVDRKSTRLNSSH